MVSSVLESASGSAFASIPAVFDSADSIEVVCADSSGSIQEFVDDSVDGDPASEVVILLATSLFVAGSVATLASDAGAVAGTVALSRTGSTLAESTDEPILADSTTTPVDVFFCDSAVVAAAACSLS